MILRLERDWHLGPGGFGGLPRDVQANLLADLELEAEAVKRRAMQARRVRSLDRIGGPPRVRGRRRVR